MFFIIVLGVLTGIYTMLGGLLAVVWTESIQTVLLLVGAVCITVVGYLNVGGWSALAHTLATIRIRWPGGRRRLPADGQLPDRCPRRERSQPAAVVFAFCWATR